MSDHNDLKNSFHWAVKSKQPACNPFAFVSKPKKILKSAKNFEIFRSKSPWKIDFFMIFYYIFL